VDLDPAVYRVRIDPEATKGVNATTVLKSKKQVKLLNEQLAEARDALDTKLRLIAKGEAGFPGLPSLKAELKTRKEAMKDLVSRAKQAEDLIAESTAEQSLLIDRIAWHQGVVQEIDDELKRINFLIDEIQSSAPKEVMSELQSQRRILTERFEASRSASERARSRIRARTKFEGSIDDVIEQRRAAPVRGGWCRAPTARDAPRSAHRSGPG
jgi:chromosome segregation ATPase